MADNKKQQTLRAHPVAECFPPLTEEEYGKLLADVREHGVRIPIVVTADGQIVDGLHRWRAAAEAGVDCPTVRLADGDDPWNAGVNLNQARRHMNESQRAMVAAALSRDSGRGQPKKSANSQNTFTQAEAAELLNVGVRSVSDGKKVLEQGSQQVVEAVKAGAVSVSDAATVVENGKQAQNGLLRAVKAGEADTLRGAMARAVAEEEGERSEWERVLSEDARLSRMLEETYLTLASLRWRWTADDSNRNKVDVKRYADAVRQEPSVIREFVERWQEERNGG